jgi:biopolymer transport protein ExbD
MSFGGFNHDSHSRPMGEINMTPLVDVMLVLLVIFMITAPMITRAIKVELPKVSIQSSAFEPDMITITLDAQGKLYWAETPVSEVELNQHLAEAAARQPPIQLYLQADKDSRYQQIAQIMIAAKQAGIQNLGFTSLPDAP